MPRKKKPSSLATLTRSVASRKRKKPSPPRKKPAKAPRDNPPVWTDAWEIILPGTVAYAGTRVAGRIGYRLARRKSPALAKHVGPWTSVAVALAGWFLVHKVKWLERYHTPVVVGASIAALQGLLQTYVPHYGWILNDYHMDDMVPAQLQARANGAPNALPADQTKPLPEPTSDDDMALEAVLNDGESVNDLYSGHFSGGWAN